MKLTLGAWLGDFAPNKLPAPPDLTLPMAASTSRLLALLLAVGLAPFARAQAPVKIDLDPSTTPRDSSPQGFIQTFTADPGYGALELAGRRYFIANTKAEGRELWSTDGTEAGTQLVIDLNPGPAPGVERFGTTMGGRLYFIGNNGVTGKELWSTDGTAAGTTLVAELVPGTGGAYLTEFTSAGNHVFFMAGTTYNNTDLWATDGTAAGTHEILPDATGITNSYFGRLIANPNGPGIYFNAKVAPYGGSIWYSDGTPLGEKLVADMDPGAGSIEFGWPVALGTKVLFSGIGPLGWELYRIDNPTSGVQLVADIEAGPGGSTPRLMSSGRLGGQLYFGAFTSATGREVFVTDGTTAGTNLFADAVPGVVGSDLNPLGVAGSTMIYSGTPHSAMDEPHVLEKGLAVMLADLNPGPKGSTLFYAESIGSQLVFGISSPDSHLAFTDGTAAGTGKIPMSKFWGPGYSILGALNPNTLLLSGTDGVSGVELMTTDGSAAGTKLLKDIDPTGAPVSSKVAKLGCVDGQDMFVLPVLSGTPALMRVQPGQLPSLLFGPSAFSHVSDLPDRVWLGDQGELVLNMGGYSSAFVPPMLYTTDGTPGGTKLLAEAKGANDSGPVVLASNGHNMLLFGVHIAYGPELWVSDGTTAGTVPIGDFFPASAATPPTHVAILDGVYYLSIPDVNGTHGLWRTDGSLAGTSMVIGGLSGAFSAPLEPVVVGGAIYFGANDQTNGNELWMSDGTPLGTAMVADIVPGFGSSIPTQLVEFEEQLHFFAKQTTISTPTLWRTDGTAAGTQQVSTATLAAGGEVIAAGAGLYFVGTSPSTGRELWGYDGTTAKLLGDLAPGVKNSFPKELTACGDRVFFSADAPSSGREVFLADCAAGTSSLAFDLKPGTDSSDPKYLTMCGSSLYLAATGTDGDRELYRYDTAHAQVVDLGFGGSGARLTATTPKLGSTLTMTIEGAPTSGSTAIGVLAMSAPVTAPLGAFAEPGNALWINPVAFALLGFGTTQTWSVTQPIPATPSLTGLHVNVQAWFLPVGLLPGKTSNGVHLVLGS